MGKAPARQARGYEFDTQCPCKRLGQLHVCTCNLTGEAETKGHLELAGLVSSKYREKSCLKKQDGGLGRWLWSYEHSLLLQRAQVMFLAPIWGGSELPITPVSEGSDASGLREHLHSHVHPHTRSRMIEDSISLTKAR